MIIFISCRLWKNVFHSAGCFRSAKSSL